MVSGIYKITNKENGKVYIGKSKNVGSRWCTYLKGEFHGNVDLESDFSKYGINSFSFEVLKVCDVSQLDFYESKYIKKYNSTRNGYNIKQELDYGDISFNEIEYLKLKVVEFFDNKDIDSISSNELAKTLKVKEEQVIYALKLINTNFNLKEEKNIDFLLDKWNGTTLIKKLNFKEEQTKLEEAMSNYCLM